MNTPQNPGNPSGGNRKSQFQARLDNQKAQLERHGNFAEVVIRTTPEGTDMINFARLWEYILTQADRQTRGYIAKSSREDFEQTRKDFDASMAYMIERMKSAVKRHKIDLTGTNFISRVAQRYDISERKAGAKVTREDDELMVPAPHVPQDEPTASRPPRKKTTGETTATIVTMAEPAEKPAARPTRKSSVTDVDGF